MRTAMLLIAIAASLPSCVDDAGGDLGQSQENLWAVDDTAQDSKVWDSGDTSHLSAWQGVTCTTDYGDNFLIAALDVSKEPSSNWDDFVARIEATCRGYHNSGDDYIPDGDSHDELVFSGDNRGDSHYHAVPYGAYYAAGVKLKVNSGSYVKDIDLRYVGASGDRLDSTLIDTGWATGYGGDDVTLSCPGQEVVTGLLVRYSTNTGKIRQLKINCRPLEFN